MRRVEIPQAHVQLSTESGQLTVEGHLMLLSMAEALREMQGLITGLGDDMTYVAQAERVVLSTYGDTVSVATKAKNLNKFGANTNVDTGQRCTVAQWQGATQYNETFVFTNAIDSVVSSSAADTQAITIEGHVITGGNLSFVTQNVTLTGQTPVVLPTPLARCSRWIIRDSGVLGAPQGALAGALAVYDSSSTAVAAGVPATPTAVSMYSPAGNTRSKKASTTISGTDYWFLSRLDVSITGGSPSTTVDFVVERRNAMTGGQWVQLGSEISLDKGTQTVFEVEYSPFLIVPKNNDVRITALSTANNVSVTADLHGYLAAVV